MLGCIGVATAAMGADIRPAGRYGGNMDYKMSRRGHTPVPRYHKGALILRRCGTRCRRDGEGLGTGIETSLDVKFTVKVRKGKPLSIPRLIKR